MNNNNYMSSRARRRAEERKLKQSQKKVKFYTERSLLGTPPDDVTDDSHGIEIHIEFINSKREGFVYFCQEETNKKLYKYLENYANIADFEDSEDLLVGMSIVLVKDFLTKYNNNDSLESIAILTQHNFSIMMAEIAEQQGNVTHLLSALATAIIAVLHLCYDGEKKGIKAYRLVFDQKNRTVDASSSTQYHLSNLTCV
jgi:predicted DNA-binding ribbon-helix-helix protein